MKVIRDLFNDADSMLSELMAFEAVTVELAKNAAPYAIGGNGRSMPRFLAETSTEMRKLLVHNFSLTYPAISAAISNGKLASGSSTRLFDACTTFDAVQRQINDAKCLLKTEADRQTVYDRLCQVVGDLVVFTLIQYQLDLLPEEVTMSVASWCERSGITTDVFYGLLLQDMKTHGQSWYAWEPISPLYEDMIAFDMALVSECEEAFYPLTDETAELLVSGKMSINTLRNQLAAFMSDMEVVETTDSPTEMLKRMTF